MSLLILFTWLGIVGVYGGNEIYNNIRLAGIGSTPYKGRVEVRKDGVWGTVCDDKWSLYDGDIVCRMLGLDKATAIREGGYFGEGSGPIHYDDLRCRKIEMDLANCPGNHGLSDCTHREDAGVECEPPTPSLHMPECHSNQFLCKTQHKCIPNRWTCDGDNDCGDNSDEIDELCKDPEDPIEIRLVGGSGPHEGRVELTHDNEWGTICDDKFTIEDAKVICKQLGFRGALATKSGAFFGKGSDHIWLDEMSCNGNEPHIDECKKSRWGDHDCTHVEDAGVICQTDDSVTIQQPTPDQCGVSKVAPRQHKILGLQTAPKGAWPWQASMRRMYRGGLSGHKCGATLISDKWAITAAHCFAKAKSENMWKIRLGEHNEQVLERTEQDIKVAKIIFHSQYNTYPHMHDIALVKFETAANLSSQWINKVCLPSVDERFDGGDICYGTGWGSNTGETGYNFILHEVSLPIVKRRTCQRLYGNVISEGMICAGILNDGKYSCQTDSGGPYVCYRNGSWKLMGISSWGKSCVDTYYPGVYTNVAKYTGWIKRIMEQE